MSGIYDKVPCKSLHRSKFDLSHRSCFTGDFGVVYPTMVEECIPGDVWKCGSEHVLKMQPMVSPMLADVKVDKHAMFVPYRLMNERWSEFISGGKDGDYDTPLIDLQAIFGQYYYRGMYYHVLHDFYNYALENGWDTIINQYLTTISSATRIYYDSNDNMTSVIGAITESWDNFYKFMSGDTLTLTNDFTGETYSIVRSSTDAMTTESKHSQLLALAMIMAFGCGQLNDMLGFPAFDELPHELTKLVVKWVFNSSSLTYTAYVDFVNSTFDDTTTFDSSTMCLSGDSTNYPTAYVKSVASSNGVTYPIYAWRSVFDKESTSAFPYLAYWYCYDEWFRHPEFDTPYYCKFLRNGALGTMDQEYEPDSYTYETKPFIGFTLFNRTWKKDYYTACLPTAQRGTAPALPISGILPVMIGSAVSLSSGLYGIGASDLEVNYDLTISEESTRGTVDLSGATTFDINDLRLANAIQRFQELNNVAGTRYTSFLKVQYGTAPADDVLQRPDYFGHCSSDINFGEVMSTTATDDDPLGTRAGKGSDVSRGFYRPYHPKEHGCIITFMSAVPKPTYCGNGVPRMWNRQTKFDYYNSLFAGIGEQEVLTSELYLTPDFSATERDTTVFGFIGRFDEYRSRVSNNKGLMRKSKFNTFTMDRYFMRTPSLNERFVHCYVDKHLFMAVPSEPSFICYFGNINHVLRPMPEYSVPSL